MNCVFCCVFNQEGYVDMFYLLLESLLLYGNLAKSNTHIIVYTSTAFMHMIKQSVFYTDHIIFELNDTYTCVDDACKSRLDFFDLPSTILYDKVVYLDIDILVKDDIKKVFDVCKDDILYVLEEGKLTTSPDDHYGGKTLFGNDFSLYDDITAFTSGILLFHNCQKIKDLFNIIKQDITQRPYCFSCHDQPYIVYNAFKYSLYNNKILKSLVVNNDYNIRSNKVIHHFPGGPGIYKHKIDFMTIFSNQLKNGTGMTIYDVRTPPLRNIAFSLIGICVSYNYFDALQFMLPVNYSHFEKIYLITQEDDVQTIEFCKKFDNVIVLLYDFKKDDKTFDKYGALNYAQQIAYTDYPDSWYLIIDSDILLPNNLIDILSRENLHADCLYGAIRNNVFKSSQLRDKKKITPYIYNDISRDFDGKKSAPPSIMGCFQLYKKREIYHRTTYINAGHGDYSFGHDNFKLFCNLDNILYFHLGEGGVNWNRKVVSFIDDANILLEDLYYYCHKDTNNIYFNDFKKVVKYGKSKDIDDDLWTCSETMRYNIYEFFKDKPNLKIAEIGAHKGYSTGILANIFSVVYAVDNSAVWMNYNRNFNKHAKNIKYVMLDIYNDSWKTLPEDIDVVFLDADHTYHSCRSDILNSLKHFKKLKYVIFDDYGVWPGVRKIVDELIYNKTLIFEKFIGLNDVPGPDGIVKNVKEGIICSINIRPTSATSILKKKQKMVFTPN